MLIYHVTFLQDRNTTGPPGASGQSRQLPFRATPTAAGFGPAGQQRVATPPGPQQQHHAPNAPQASNWAANFNPQQQSRIGGPQNHGPRMGDMETAFQNAMNLGSQRPSPGPGPQFRQEPARQQGSAWTRDFESASNTKGKEREYSPAPQQMNHYPQQQPDYGYSSYNSMPYTSQFSGGFQPQYTSYSQPQMFQPQQPMQEQHQHHDQDFSEKDLDKAFDEFEKQASAEVKTEEPVVDKGKQKDETPMPKGGDLEA